MGKLTNPKHERFAVLVAKGNPARRAYVLAYGIDEPQQNEDRLTKNDLVRKRIEELQHRYAARAEVSATYLLENLKKVAARCMQAEPVMIRNEDGEMVPSGQWRFDASGATKAFETIAKMIGAFEHTKRVDIHHSGAVETIDVTRLSNATFTELRDSVLKAQLEAKKD